MRVLWLTPDKPADISVGRRRIAEHLERSGIEVTLRGTTPGTALRSLRECARGRYDAVVGTTRAGAFVGAAARLLGTPLVVDHVDPIRQFAGTHPRPLAATVRVAENAAFALADRVLYVYEEERPRVERYARGAIETDLGVAYDRFADPDPAAVERARERLAGAGVDLDGRIAVYVGGLEPIYRVPELLAAMTHRPEWTLVVLGAGSLEDRVERAARERENVAFLGTVPHEDVPGYLAAADVGLSLVDDPHTLKVLEYAAAGLGVVQAAGRAEARFGDCVEYCDTRPRGIADAIQRAGDRGTSDAFRERIRQFDYGTVAGDYREALRAVVGSDGDGGSDADPTDGHST
ncbi:glycosyl transferase family 1 [Halobacteriales archaeon QS_5_70_17]|nr:MAG: glycosyl transferase family 1 [Halobacteriales archaeon QS_5_70_17]